MTIERSEVTIIPTYDTDVLGYWVAENEELLTELKIDLAPSASRCTINLQVMIVSPRTTIAARLQLIVGMSPGIVEHRAPARKKIDFNFVAMAMLTIE